MMDGGGFKNVKEFKCDREGLTGFGKVGLHMNLALFHPPNGDTCRLNNFDRSIYMILMLFCMIPLQGNEDDGR